jgi:G3E family GTPase
MTSLDSLDSLTHSNVANFVPMTVPITLVAGFLGVGKTTLVNRLLADAPQRLAVLVNDFAAINVDATLIESSAPGRIALTNGCVCCTLRDDLLAAALELAAAEPRPERIVIETSGVAEPYGVMEAFLTESAEGRVAIDSAVCIVDAEQFPLLDYASGELALDQAAVCDIVLLNKCDLVGETEARAVEATLLGAQPAMRIHRTTHASLPWPVLLGADERRHAGSFDCSSASKAPADSVSESVSHRHHHHGVGYASTTRRFEGPIDLAAFRTFVASLPRSVLRAKGVVRCVDEPHARGIFQLVGKRSSLTFEPDPSGARHSEIVVIGPSPGFEPATADALFAALERASIQETV